MDTEIPEESAISVERKTNASGSPVHSDYVGGDDSDAKMTLAVTSDEDSRESAKGRNCLEDKRVLELKEGRLDNITEMEEISPKDNDVSERRKSSTSSVERSSWLDTPVAAKRKLSDAYSPSDEEDLLGFDDETGEPLVIKRFKKIKEDVEEEKENIKIEEDIKPVEDEKPPIKLEEPEIETVKPQPAPEVLESPKGSPKPQIEAEKLQTPQSSKAKASKDVAYRKPFDMGWKREFVYRAIPGVSKEKGEVYYISPTGKKLRTRNELQQHITPGLTLDNFTFSKEPLGYEEEVVRSAKPTMRSTPSTPVDSANRESLGKRIPKPKAPKGASPPPQGWTASKAVKSAAVQSPRPAPAPRPPEDSEIKSANKTSSKGGKSVKKNSTIESSTAPSLQTGDDLPIRKRLPNSRNKFSPDSPASHQPQQQHIVPAPSTAVRPSSESFAANFFSNVSLGYEILFQIFQYLKVQELLRAACVCRVWYVVANNRALWKTVRMKNSQVNDWTGLAAALRRNETMHLDLRKMLTSSTNADEMWASFSKNIQTVVSLETIDLCRCSSKIVESLFETNPNLKVINAVTIKDETLNLENLSRLANLEELRLKSIDGCTLESDLMSLQSLKNLRHLSLTSFRELGLKEIDVIGELTNLESLELGECSEFSTKFSENVLLKLTKLERLRLEKGQAECCTLEILDAVAQLHKLAQLELVNFDVKIGFDEKLAMCKNIKRLLLIPTYISQSATTNNIVLSAVLQLSDTLQTLTWAVTLELLRVTALYVDQCDNKKKDKKFFDESIPVLKPVPGIADDNEKSQKNTSDVPQVEILPLVKVEKILTMGMPTTKFKILKVPYHFTWRQNLVDLH